MHFGNAVKTFNDACFQQNILESVQLEHGTIQSKHIVDWFTALFSPKWLLNEPLSLKKGDTGHDASVEKNDKWAQRAFVYSIILQSGSVRFCKTG